MPKEDWDTNVSQGEPFFSEEFRFSEGTDVELKELGLEASDIEAINGCRGGFHSRVLSVVGDQGQRRIAKLSRDIEREKAEYVKKVKVALGKAIPKEGLKKVLARKVLTRSYYVDCDAKKYEERRNSITRKYNKLCGNDFDKWLFVAQNILGQGDGVIIEAAAELIDEFGGNLGNFKKVTDILVGMKPAIVAKYEKSHMWVELPHIRRDDEKKMDEAILALAKQKGAYRGDVEVFGIYASLAQEVFHGAEEALKTLATADDVHENSKGLMEISSRVLKCPNIYHLASREARFKFFREAKPVYQQDLGMASDVADVCSEYRDAEDLKEPIHALLDNKQLFEDDLQKRKQFVKLAQMGGADTGGYAVKLLAKMQPSYGEKGENFVAISETIGDLCYKRKEASQISTEDSRATNLLRILSANERIADGGVEGLKAAIKNLRVAMERNPYVSGLFPTLDLAVESNVLRSLELERRMCGDIHAFRLLLKFESVYGGDIEKLEQIGAVVADLVERGGGSACELLLGFGNVYGTDVKKFEQIGAIVAEVGRKGGDPACVTLLNLKDFYGTDVERLEKVGAIVVEVGEKGGQPACKAFPKFSNIYGTDIEKLEKVGAIVAEVGEKGGQSACEALPNFSNIYGGDIERLRQVGVIVANVCGKGGQFACKALLKLKDFYGTDVERLEKVGAIVAEVGEKGGQSACEALVSLESLHQNDLEKLKFLGVVVSDAVVRLGQEIVKELVKFKDLYGNDISKLEKAVKYSESTNIFDIQVLTKYIEIFEAEGEEAARGYIESISGKAKGLVSSEVPFEQRGLTEYQYLVRYVFPSGNYSTHEKNLACGDRLEHISGYNFDHKGYPVVMTGLLGHKIKEGATTDDSVLSSYTERLGRIREFVSSRGPDNKALQEVFVKKVDTIFEGNAWAEFKEIEGLTLEEKLLCLFLGEAFRRKQKGESGNADPQICDLIAEYKYAFNEDLEAYVRRSADSVKSYKDKTSQNYMLLSELSVIYGENVKHILRHNILEKSEGGKNGNRILEVFSSKIGEGREAPDLTLKQWERVNNTFSNERIPAEKRFDILYQQIYKIFSSNIKFESEESRAEFDERLKEICEKMRAELTIGKFKEILPEFFQLRSLYRSGINERLSELFTQDVNRIFAELAKYEEEVEVEDKEKRMGGVKEKHAKKSTKRRNISGFFTKTAEAANARMGAYVCIAGDPEMWKNENYFEFVMVDTDTNKCVGTAMLLKIEAEDGKKYLWFGPNPFESFLDVVSSGRCYEYLYQAVRGFASENGFDGVVVPSKDEQILGQCTNRGGDFPGLIKESRLRDKKGNLKIVSFGKKHTLGSYCSTPYGYEDGALIWEK